LPFHSCVCISSTLSKTKIVDRYWRQREIVFQYWYDEIEIDDVNDPLGQDASGGGELAPEPALLEMMKLEPPALLAVPELSA
jgi:hypothetical protein